MPKQSRQTRQIRLPGLEEDCPPVATESPATETRASEATAELVTTVDDIADACAIEPAENGVAPPDDLTGKTVYVIDSHSLIFQVFHAIAEMTSPSGRPVSAVFGFTRDILGILEQRKPDYLFCAFDMPGDTFRHQIFPAYKEHRSEMPVDLVPQIDSICRILKAMGVPVVGASGYEADDVLATIAHTTHERGGACVLVTGDKDCRQLITDRVKMFNIRKNQFIGAEELLADWGVRPEQVVDYQALVGDPVDNVPGVPLIGPKLAREMLQKYGTLENLFDHVNEIAGEKRKQNLIAGREQAFISRRLAALDKHSPVAIDWPAGETSRHDPVAARELFEEFGFHSLTQKMRDQAPKQKTAWVANYQTIDTPEKLRWLVAEMSQQPRISMDTETTCVAPRWAEIVGYSFCWKEGEAYYVPVRGPAGSAHLNPTETLEALRPVLENPRIGKIGQNIKYEIIVLRSAGVELAGVDFDTMVASYLIDAGERNHNLDELAARYFGHKTTQIGELIGTGKQQKRMDEVPLPLITHYAAEDADVPWRLRPILGERLGKMACDRLYHDVELPLIEVLAELEYNGIRLDVGRLEQLSKQYDEKLTSLEQQIYELAGRPFNIGSTKQLQQVLFEEQNLPRLRKNKTGSSTDADVLEELALQHPLPAKIIEYRQFAKLKNTYVDALPALVYPKTGRVHTSFNQSVAATGRLSSSDPNLQNIPIRTQEGREIRSAFLPGYDGWRLIAADYSQIELRVLAHFSGDATLLESFARDEDIHARVAGQVFGVHLEGVTSEMRRVAKAVNFGVIYGQSPFGLAKMLGIEQRQAAEFIRAYFAGYPGVYAFLEETIAQCRKQGYVSTILGRRRTISGIGDGKPKFMQQKRQTEPSDAEALLTDGDTAPANQAPAAQVGNVLRQKSLAERTAINTVIQGSAADLIKLAMIKIHRRLKADGFLARMLLQIHDELMFEAPPEECDRLITLIQDEMAGVMPLGVPLKVDVKVGATWADCEPV